MSAPSRGAAPPPPTTGSPPLLLWLHLPPANRRWLLWLLSQLLERQLPVAGGHAGEEGRDERDAPR